MCQALWAQVFFRLLGCLGGLQEAQEVSESRYYVLSVFAHVCLSAKESMIFNRCSKAFNLKLALELHW